MKTLKRSFAERPTNKTIYVENVNISYSFKTLEAIAIQHGAKLEAEDILIADNANKTKRKAFKKTVNGAIIVYAMLFRDKFTEVEDKSALTSSFTFQTYREP